MSLSHKEAIGQLELGTIQKKLDSSQPTSVSYQVKLPDGELAAVKFRTSEEVNVMAHLHSWVTDTHTRRTRRGDTETDDDFDPLAAILEEFSRQDEAARKAGGRFIVALVRTGHIEDSAYCVRPWRKFSLQQLIDGNVRPRSSAELFSMVHNVWAALCFLHQQKLNVPHGNLKPSNVLLEEDGEGGWIHLLTDMQMLRETDYVVAKQQDMQALGMLIVQYCEGKSHFADWMAADDCAKRARWDFLEDHQQDWKRIARQLLTPERYNEEYDPAVDMHKELRPLRPQGFQLTVVPPPQHVETTVRSSLVAERLRQVRRKIDNNEWLDAIEELCRLEEQCREGENARQRPEVLTALALAADLVPSIESSPHALKALQKAAQGDCAIAAFKLGDYYRRSEPAVAARYLARAAELGMAQALVTLGQMYLHGAPGLLPDISEAAKNFEDAIKLNDLPEAKLQMAALILRGDTFHRQEKALEYLTDASDAKVQGATGLLGLCYATGIGVPQDMQRAFKLFQEAWQESEDRGEPDFTALNNLAVCVANGYGVLTADFPRALRQMEKAAEGGCKGAQRNLERMPRRVNLPF